MNRAERYALWAGVTGVAVAALAWLLVPLQFYGGWLAAFTLFIGWPLGSIALLLVHALVGGRWGDTLHPALRIGVCTLPLILPALLPLAAGLSTLYPWDRPQAQFGNHFYLNLPFLAARWVVYLSVWGGLGLVVLRGRGVAAVAPAGLFALAITVTFAAIDSTISLDPGFSSSIYGMIAAAGMGLLALSLAVLLTAVAIPEGQIEDLGKLLLALVILWIYLDFMQILIVWQSDLAKEAPWYLTRARGGWGAFAVVIAALHFLLPFALLLSPRMQRSRPALVVVAALLVAAEILRAWWTVLPSLGLSVSWPELTCMLAFAGLALATAPRLARAPGSAFAQQRPHG